VKVISRRIAWLNTGTHDWFLEPSTFVAAIAFGNR
jgi:hypothetical protein